MGWIFIIFVIFILLVWDSLYISHDSLKSNFYISHIKKIINLDLRSLALFRICLALFIIFDLINRASYIQDHYTDLGIFPRTLSVQYMYPWNFSLHLISGKEEIQCALFIINGFCALALFLGYKTRLATFLCWLFLLSLHTCNPLIMLTSDYFIRLILFWSIFLPLGAYYSIDRSLNPSVSEKSKKSTSTIPTAIYIVQIIFIYLFSSILTLSTDYKDFVFSLTSLSSEITSLFSQAGTTTKIQLLLFELILPLLLLVPFHTDKIRAVVIAAFFGLYIGLKFFPFYSMIAFIPFFPGFMWEKTSLEKILLLDYIEKIGAFLQKRFPSIFSPIKTEFKRLDMLHIIPALILTYTLYWNISISDTGIKPYYKFPEKLLWLGNLIGVNYPWVKFSIISLLNEEKSNQWFVIRGLLKEGAEIDLLRDGGKLRWDKPLQESDIYNNARWRQALFNVFMEPFYKMCQPYYGYHLCMKWNYKHSDKEQLQEIEFYTNETSKSRTLVYSCQCAGDMKTVEEKIKEIESKYKNDDLTFINELYNLAAAYFKAGKYSDAERIYKSICKKEEELYGKDSKYLVNCLELLATIYKLQGKELEAEAISEQVRKINNE